MTAGPTPRLPAILQALLVTLLWASSWVLIKIGLEEIPPLNFAAYRYVLASLMLSTGFLARGGRLSRTLPWRQLAVLALLTYTVAQGSQFLALRRIPASMGSVVLASIPIWSALVEIRALGTRPKPVQLLGMLLALTGAYLFFYPLELAGTAWGGVLIMLVAAWASAGATVLARRYQLGPHVGALRLTTVTMGLGSLWLLALAWSWEGIAMPSPTGWAIVAYLAAVNTAFAWTLWNHALRTLAAFEISVIANLMLVEIAVLAWLFLAETLTARDWAGILVLVGGATLVHAPALYGRLTPAWGQDRQVPRPRP